MGYKQKLKFSFECPTKIVFGSGSLADLPMEMEELGSEKALVVTDEGISQGTDFTDRVKSVLGNKYVGLFDEVKPDSSLDIVEKGYGLGRDIGADIVVSIGGGSSMDTAKGIAVLLKHGGEVRDYVGSPSLKGPVTPHIAIPTTAGTGSEVTFVSVLKDPSELKKVLIMSNYLIPNTAILDPDFTISLPPELTAQTGMDALTHAIEALISRRKSPVSDGLAIHAIRLIKMYLPRCVENGKDISARGQMLIASTLAGLAFSHALVGVVHAIAHTIGARYNIHHGLANSIMLPYCLKYNIDNSADDFLDRYLQISRALGVGEEGRVRSSEFGVGSGERRGTRDEGRGTRDGALDGVEAVLSIVRGLGLKMSLKEVGVPKEDFDKISMESLQDLSILTNPIKIMDPGEIKKILEEAWEGGGSA